MRYFFPLPVDDICLSRKRSLEHCLTPLVHRPWEKWWLPQPLLLQLLIRATEPGLCLPVDQDPQPVHPLPLACSVHPLNLASYVSFLSHNYRIRVFNHILSKTLNSLASFTWFILVSTLDNLHCLGTFIFLDYWICLEKFAKSCWLDSPTKSYVSSRLLQHCCLLSFPCLVPVLMYWSQRSLQTHQVTHQSITSFSRN